ncbi:hypothetical protein ACFPIJ_16125 [Dactylosporangium cerinum]|uniref:Uncharacterized protein n=1 Tax=Dactylosporangium cerinum TaxID=1434730 RepID=A0ABV9VUL5_9ACTN
MHVDHDSSAVSQSREEARRVRTPPTRVVVPHEPERLRGNRHQRWVDVEQRQLIGPLETIEGIDRITVANPELTAIAQRYTGEQHRPTASVIVAAEALLPALVSLIDTTVR